MPDIYANARSTTSTTTRKRDVNPTSGMCPICIKDCTVLCEVGKSAFRSREVLYPEPEEFGYSTASSNKDYDIDWSHFQILTDVIGAKGIEANSDVATFPNVDISTSLGGVSMEVPFYTTGLGSTDVARNFWDGCAIGCAISGTMIMPGENICGVDLNSKFDSNGKVTHSDELSRRIESFRKFWDGKHGDVGVQTNVEDQRLGVDVYALSKLEVNIIERKWGQGAKAIGGEIRLYDLEKALTLKKRGYIVHPDPEDEVVQKAFKAGAFKTFERHSRVGMPEAKSFVEDVEWLRDQGAKKVFLKTGAYRPSATAFTLKVASEAKVDQITFDGAGGGTGMSPVPMMNDCSVPTVYLFAQVMHGIDLLKKSGRYVPDISFAGGFVNEAQAYKCIAMSNFGTSPYVKAIAMARAPLTAAMKAEYFGELAAEGQLPKSFASKYGSKPEQFFATYPELEAKYGSDMKDIPMSAIGVYSYFQRLKVGLQQLMAGARKFKLELIDRGDLASLSDLGTRVTGIPSVLDVDYDVMEEILG
ncbi:MAG: glutamate synthase-related protein [Halobacteriota archaeon]|nr:glutamate synthase-related protein [Halobacteriota archaeon]MDY6958509.1 glutamate synthase-related protein [Halobacteriota archaeon]